MKTKAARTEYLTTRIVEGASRKAFKKASVETMKVMGHTIIAKDGWVVRKNADGSVEKLQKIERSGNGHQPLILD
jgi:hypothetical protein